MTAMVERLKPGHFLRTGHRGASGLAPENTMASFQKAIDLGVDLIELDVQPTADGRIAVLHDPTVDRTTDGAGEISRMTYDDIRRLDAGYRFGPPNFPFRGRDLRVPLLAEVFDAFPHMSFVIEIKKSLQANFLETLAGVIRNHAPDRVVLASDGSWCLDELRRRLPDVPTNITRQEVQWFYFVAKAGLSFLFRSRGAVFQVPIYAGGEARTGLRVVTRGFVRAAHRIGKPVHVWTINDPAEMRELIDLGVDGITTDRPDILNEGLRQSNT